MMHKHQYTRYYTIAEFRHTYKHTSTRTQQQSVVVLLAVSYLTSLPRTPLYWSSFCSALLRVQHNNTRPLRRRWERLFCKQTSLGSGRVSVYSTLTNEWICRMHTTEYTYGSTAYRRHVLAHNGIIAIIVWYVNRAYTGTHVITIDSSQSKKKPLARRINIIPRTYIHVTAVVYV